MRVPAQRLDTCPDNHATQSCRKPLSSPLSADELEAYRTDGFVVKKGLLADLAEDLQGGADALLEMDELREVDNLRIDWTRGEEPAIWKIDPFVDLMAFWGRLVRDRRIADALASIYEGREPRLMKDKLIYKPPHSRGNELHQDYTWWQGMPTSAISVCIAVDYTTVENGATTLYPGAHHQGLLHEPGILGGLPRSAVEGFEPTVVCASPGDVIFFGCFTPHEAGSNTTDGYRRQIFLTYNDSADGEWHKAHYDHFFNYRLRRMPAEEHSRKYFL